MAGTPLSWMTTVPALNIVFFVAVRFTIQQSELPIGEKVMPQGLLSEVHLLSTCVAIRLKNIHKNFALDLMLLS